MAAIHKQVSKNKIKTSLCGKGKDITTATQKVTCKSCLKMLEIRRARKEAS